MRKLLTTVFAFLFSVTMASTALAGIGWNQQTKGVNYGKWYYATNINMTDRYHADKGDGTPKWVWIDGVCYAFDKEGWLYQYATTPDGYTVNQVGAWTVDGVIQRQTVTTPLGTTEITDLTESTDTSTTATKTDKSGWVQVDGKWKYATDTEGTVFIKGSVDGGPKWEWIDGDGNQFAECYSFDADGFLYQDCTTPDGFKVNANGAWISDGGAVHSHTLEEADAEKNASKVKEAGENYGPGNNITSTSVTGQTGTTEAAKSATEETESANTTASETKSVTETTAATESTISSTLSK